MPPYTPRYPFLAAAGILTLWIAVLCLPMLAGKWLAGPFSDQMTAGVPFRGWGAEWWRRLGHIPLWNPEILGGMPYVGAIGTGDVLYPTAVLLRLVLPTPLATNVGFFIHYVAAGVFTYALLRSLRVSWSGAVIGGLAYQLSGIMASYVQPGHDGKLVVSALMPLVLFGLVRGMRDEKPTGYGLIAVGVALSILTQHVQVTYYMLITAGLFALYLAFGVGALPGRARVAKLALALAAVIVGFGIAAIQLLPAFEQMPLSTRATAVQGGFAGATSFATPWVDVPEFFFKQFVGWGYPGTPGSTYWGPAPLKFHSEYLGLPVIALAILGAGRRTSVDRRLRQWLAGIGLLFLLIALGDGTPFYHLWWALMPYVKQMRAPGMAFFVTAFIVSCFAGFGVERIERSAGAGSEERMPSYVRAWLVAGGAFILFAAAGVFAALARALADERRNAVVGHAVTLGALTSALALVLLAVIAWLRVRRRLPPLPFVLLLVVVVGGDLWLNARPYWTYTITDRTLFQNDQITERIKATPGPTRVVDIGNVYPGNVLMALDVSQLLGQHGLELRYFDDVMGGHGVWRNLGNVHLWDLFAVRWVIAPSNASGLDSIPGYIRVARDVPTSAGNPAQLYERTAPVPYARVIPAALSLDSATIIRTVADPRMTYDRVVLLDQRDGVSTPPLAQLPAASKTHAAITHWEPGRMGIVLDPAPTAPVYVVVAENWYPDWRATVDGAPVRVLRGDWTLITVPVPANARQIELTFVSSTFRRGEILSIASLVIVLATVIGPPLWRRWRGGRLQHA